MLCAGLYPNVAKLSRAGKRDFYFSTATERRIGLHPKSINSGTPIFETSQWVVYYEMVRLNNKPCLMECSLIPAFPIMFFGGALGKRKMGDGELVPMYEAATVDEWITFQCDWKYADLIERLRRQLDEVLEYKISHPSVSNWNTHTKEGATLRAIVDILSEERMVATNQM